MSTAKKKGHRIYALVVIVLGLAIIALSILLLFYVQKIEVSGNEYTKDQEIVETVEEDRYAVNSLYLLWKYHFTKYKKPGSLTAMNVSLKNPWTVKVKVEEKKILGYVYDDEGYVYFDKDGTVVLKGTDVIEGTPCIEGIDISNAVLYEHLKSGDKDLFELILKVIQEVEKFKLTPDRIVCVDNGINLYFGEVCAALGDKITTEKMAQISPILEKLAGRAGTLHLEHYEDSSDTITFEAYVPPAPEEESGEGQVPEDTGEEGYDDSWESDYSEDYSDESGEDWSDEWDDSGENWDDSGENWE